KLLSQWGNEDTDKNLFFSNVNHFHSVINRVFYSLHTNLFERLLCHIWISRRNREKKRISDTKGTVI
ncbi:unnamed protein product, partial [Brassica oleracea]